MVNEQIQKILQESKQREIKAAQVPKPPAICGKRVTVKYDSDEEALRDLTLKLIDALEGANDRLIACYTQQYAIYHARRQLLKNN